MTKKNENNRYSAGLKGAMRLGDKKAVVTGLGMGVTMFIMFGTYGLAFWYGGQLIIKDVSVIVTSLTMTCDTAQLLLCIA